MGFATQAGCPILARSLRKGGFHKCIVHGMCCTYLWVAQRFTAAILDQFPEPALAAAVRLLCGKRFLRTLMVKA